ncbi:putative DNA endonuclease SmrA [invertebrate metagenome]|uniref:Putative DNA endonuclease SmrA n=1 Tax=invertebrate metagenome TaxID=1711999 RepID=A0A2H9TA75_9ZZZZ
MSDNKKNAHSQLFQDEMRGVKPLKSKKQVIHSVNFHHNFPESTLKTRRKAAEREQIGTKLAFTDMYIDPVEPEQYLSFIQKGIQAAQLKRLRQAFYPIEYNLDLHGYKIEAARNTVTDFLHYCLKRNMHCVRIIHGKSPHSQDRQCTLKSHVNHWLQQPSCILAFCSAPQNQGGTGAVLILLRKQKKTH